MIDDTLKQVKELREENARLTSAAQMQPSIYGLIEQERRIEIKDKRIAELEAQVPKVSVVRYFAGDFVCECGWVVDVGIGGDTKFNYCAGCGAKLDWTEEERWRND